jgi:hypothetical protein
VTFSMWTTAAHGCLASAVVIASCCLVCGASCLGKPWLTWLEGTRAAPVAIVRFSRSDSDRITPKQRTVQESPANVIRLL